jgi:hypothetical protein
MDPIQARKTWRTLEPVHGMIYFVPEAAERYRALGIGAGQMGYFAGRAAPMGPVPAEVVIATFFNFNPKIVREAIPAAWRLADPADVVQARLEAADAALRRAWDDGALKSPELAEAATLARRAAEVACTRPEGRALFASYCTLDWPEEAHLALFHAQTLLREFRGDGHVSALLLAGVDPVEALVLHAGTGSAQLPASILQLTRAWTDEEWGAAVERLLGRGLIELVDGEPLLTEAGGTFRDGIEDLTDRASAFPYAAIGDEGCDRLRELARPLSRQIISGGLLSIDPGRGR